jgi:TM2 domain-containing membrane protein YozV
MTARHKNKTVATWLAFLGGPLGLHRFYLYGPGDIWGWLHPIPTALGLWGIERVLALGQDDKLSWVLLPVLGFLVATTCLTAILYALTDKARWNARHNPTLAPDATPGHTHWYTIVAVVFALMVGAIGFMSGVVFSFQHYFEYQVEEGLKLSQ